jgi:hypothetical protein
LLGPLHPKKTPKVGKENTGQTGSCPNTEDHHGIGEAFEVLTRSRPMCEANEKGNGRDRIDQNNQRHAPSCVSVPLPFDKSGVHADISFFADAYFFSAIGGWHGSGLQLQNGGPL